LTLIVVGARAALAAAARVVRWAADDGDARIVADTSAIAVHIIIVAAFDTKQSLRLQSIVAEHAEKLGWQRRRQRDSELFGRRGDFAQHRNLFVRKRKDVLHEGNRELRVVRHV
jgi:hypothetical protein